MDQRLQHIIENFESMKIGVDEPFRFGCKQCGKCCINREDILLNAQDVYRLSKELDMSPQDMIELYGETYIGENSRIPIVRLRPRGSVRRCQFLKERKCSVHKAKPTVCALFPIGRSMLFDKSKGEKPDYENAEIQYILDLPDCGDKSETHTVRAWLKEFGIPVDDPFFKKWNQTITEVGSIVHRIEGKLPDSILEMMWNAIYALLYLNYYIEDDFMPQFEENSHELLKLMCIVSTGEEEK